MLPKKTNKHLLVVDDDDRLRALLKKFLIQSNFDVTVSESAEEAELILKSMSFDLVILDIMLPGKSGLEFIDIIKSYTPIPVLLLTARGDPEDRIKGLESGSDDYLSKPFEPQELVLRIQNLLERYNH